MSNKTADEQNGRIERTRDFLDALAHTQRINLVGIEFLTGIIEDHPDRVYHGVKERPDSNLIIRGGLANYCIPLEPIFQAFTNPFSEDCNLGIPMVEVHPLGQWVRHPAYACIQPNGHSQIPGTDSIGILITALISDRELFANQSQGPFRNALVKTYGMIHSPISEVLAKSLKDLYGATIDFAIGEISIKGTHGFTWHLGGAHDPSVTSYSLSSSVRGGPHRVHTADTFHSMGSCKDLSYLLPTLSQSPRIFLSDDDYDLTKSPEILSSVAKIWAPLRKAIDSGEIELLDSSESE
tara:strand:- start:457 stop:1341 length:885 start_codon:yes stop_codon:yes gene_type:complete